MNCGSKNNECDWSSVSGGCGLGVSNGCWHSTLIGRPFSLLPFTTQERVLHTHQWTMSCTMQKSKGAFIKQL